MVGRKRVEVHRARMNQTPSEVVAAVPDFADGQDWRVDWPRRWDYLMDAACPRMPGADLRHEPHDFPAFWPNRYYRGHVRALPAEAVHRLRETASPVHLNSTV